MLGINKPLWSVNIFKACCFWPAQKWLVGSTLKPLQTQNARQDLWFVNFLPSCNTFLMDLSAEELLAITEKSGAFVRIHPLLLWQVGLARAIGPYWCQRCPSLGPDPPWDSGKLHSVIGFPGPEVQVHEPHSVATEPYPMTPSVNFRLLDTGESDLGDP